MRQGEVALGPKYGNYPLHIALQQNSVDCVLVLLRIGIDINVNNKMGDTPLYLATSLGHTHLVQLLEENGAKMYNKKSDNIPSTFMALDVEPDYRIEANYTDKFASSLIQDQLH